MHYHLLLVDARGGEFVHRPDTYATQEQAESEAQALSEQGVDSGWRPTRYPGRPWKRQEVAVYLDRSDTGARTFPYLELVVVRCTVAGADRSPGCYLMGRGVRHDPDG